MKKELFPVIQIPKQKNWLYFLVFFLIDSLLGFLVTNALDYFSPDFAYNTFAENVPLLLWFITGVIGAPLFETIVFQFAILELLTKWKVSASISIMISTFIFSLFHDYNITYIIYILLCGWVLPYYYMALRHQGKYNKILLVFLLHVLGNFIAFLEYL